MLLPPTVPGSDCIASITANTATILASEQAAFAYYYEDDPLAGCIRYPTEAESERLMGLPPDWTKYGADGAEIRSSSRYATIGNSVALPCAEYIMEGIAEALQK